MNSWNQVKKQLSTKMSNEAYANWVSRTALKGCFGDRLTIMVPDEATKICMESDYGDLVASSVRELQLPVRYVTYEVGVLDGLPNRTNGRGSEETGSTANEVVFGPPTTQLNSRLTFDSFVVGPCNQFSCCTTA